MAAEKAPSFDFYPAEWLIATMGLTLAESGRLFTRVARTVACGDRAGSAEWQGKFIGRIYWREKPNRPYIQPAIRHAVHARYGGRCRRCDSEDRLELDHVIPFSRGGADSVDNLQLLCKPCNRSKGAR